MQPTQSAMHRRVIDYYSRALVTHGACPRGVDWSSRESQELRFGVLLEGVRWTPVPSLLDYGCGYGALGAYLDRLERTCRYVGYDLAPTMLVEARRANRGRSDRAFIGSEAELVPADYVIASGVFNVKLDVPAGEWEAHLDRTLARLGSLSRRMLSFNLLPPASSPRLARRHLYYADPGAVVALCKERLGGRVSLRQGYGLHEFTVAVTWQDRA